MLACINPSLIPARNLCGEIDHLFGDWLRIVGSGDVFGPFGAVATRTVPPMNVWEDEQAVHVEAELPGWSMDELDVSLLGDELTISGERAKECSDNVKFHRRERSCGSFRRLLRFPDEVDAEKVTANLRDGVLTVTLPKVEAVKPRKINVQGN